MKEMERTVRVPLLARYHRYLEKSSSASKVAQKHHNCLVKTVKTKSAEMLSYIVHAVSFLRSGIYTCSTTCLCTPTLVSLSLFRSRLCHGCLCDGFHQH